MEKEKQQINSTHPFMRNDGDYRKLRYGHAVIYRPDEWFFVHIPKNGGTSFASHAKKFRENYKKLGVHLLYIDFNELHNQADILQEKYKEVLINCTPVCLTRNPWSRCLSLYMFNLQAAVRPLNIREEWAMHVHSRLSREGFKKAWMPEGHFRDEDNMQEGIRNNPNRTWVENSPQHGWMNPFTKHFKLESELKDFYDYLDIPPLKRHINKSGHHDYHLYYDDELREEIGKLYEKDIEMFNYTF